MKAYRKIHFAARITSILLALCMAMALLPTFAFAVDGELSVRIVVKNGQNGSTQYKVNDGEWIDLNESRPYDIEGINADDRIYVRAIPNSEQELDTTGTGYWVNRMSENMDLDALQSNDGWSFVCTAGDTIEVTVEYRGGNAPAPSNSGKLGFTCQSEAITGGSIFYKLNNAGDFIKVSEENNRYNSVSLSDTDTSIAIKFEINEGYSLDTVRGVTLRVDGNDVFSSTNDNVGDFVSENGHTFILADLVGDGSVSESSFDLEFGFGNENGGPGPEPGDEPAHGGYEGDMTTGTVTFAGQADLFINDSRMVNGNDGDSFDVSYTYNNSGTVDFYFDCFINERYTSLKINGVDYFDQLPTPDTAEGREALLEACKGQLNEFKITVPHSDNYAVEADKKFLDDLDIDYMVVGNFLWTYEDSNQKDDYLDHGTIELLNVHYNGKDYKLSDLNNPDTCLDWGEPDENNVYGSAVLPVGSVVTVKLVPDYGYQLTSFGINGGSFGTGDEQSVFTFEIKPGNAHLGAHFTPVEDKVTSTAQAVSEGNIALGDSGLSGGSAQLKISDAELDDEKEAEFASATPSGYTVSDYLDVDLYNVYYKGSTDSDDVWEQEIDTLNEDATISVKLSDSQLEGIADPSDIVLIHNVHNGDEYETISVESYDPETNTITFKTDSFSTYALATNDQITYGDANDDGDIDMRDVLLIRKYIAKQPVKPNLAASDVTYDGDIDMRDVLLIRKYIAKQPVTLGPQN